MATALPWSLISRVIGESAVENVPEKDKQEEVSRGTREGNSKASTGDQLGGIEGPTGS